MVRASLVIASHNEGDRLQRTVHSCVKTTEGMGFEILIADDASNDGSLEETRRLFPQVRVVRHRRRRGVSPTKDLGGRKARGETLVFLDGHCKPEPWAIERLVNDVENSGGRAVVTPRVPALDATTWENNLWQMGYGYRLDLPHFNVQWIELQEMRPRGQLFENPALIGCCAAMSRDLYSTVGGFDRDMVDWGCEDIDFGLRCWVMGYSILLNPRATVGHRFRESFDNYSVSTEAVPVNMLRMARKNLSDVLWEEWLRLMRAEVPKKAWKRVWKRFSKRKRSVEKAREYHFSHRAMDEFWYAQRFGISWPAAVVRMPNSA